MEEDPKQTSDVQQSTVVLCEDILKQLRDSVKCQIIKKETDPDLDAGTFYAHIKSINSFVKTIMDTICDPQIDKPCNPTVKEIVHMELANISNKCATITAKGNRINCLCIMQYFLDAISLLKHGIKRNVIQSHKKTNIAAQISKSSIKISVSPNVCEDSSDTEESCDSDFENKECA